MRVRGHLQSRLNFAVAYVFRRHPEADDFCRLKDLSSHLLPLQPKWTTQHNSWPPGLPYIDDPTRSGFRTPMESTGLLQSEIVTLSEPPRQW